MALLLFLMTSFVLLKHNNDRNLSVELENERLKIVNDKF